MVEREAHSKALFAPCTFPVTFHSPGSRLSPVEAFGMEYRDIARQYGESGEGFYPFVYRF